MCWNTGVALIGPNKSGPYLHLMPIFGGILAFLVFQETLHIYHYAGIVSVIIGIIITNTGLEDLDLGSASNLTDISINNIAINGV